jgi:hypothetical protein
MKQSVYAARECLLSVTQIHPQLRNSTEVNSRRPYLAVFFSPQKGPRHTPESERAKKMTRPTNSEHEHAAAYWAIQDRFLQ